MGGHSRGRGLMQPGGPRVHSEAQAAEERRGDRRERGDLKVAPRPGSALPPLLATWSHVRGRAPVTRASAPSDLGDRKGLGWP